MRDIEFRVWVEDKGVFADTCCVYNDGSASYEIEQCDVSGRFIASIGSSVGDRDSLEQYTGLKDKNGTKIFEGDKVSVVIDDEDCIIIVRFIIGKEINGWEIYYRDIVNGLIVVGNIHQNPELIGG